MLSCAKKLLASMIISRNINVILMSMRRLMAVSGLSWCNDMTAEEKNSNLGKYLVRVMNEAIGNRFSSDLEMKILSLRPEETCKLISHSDFKSLNSLLSLSSPIIFLRPFFDKLLNENLFLFHNNLANVFLTIHQRETQVLLSHRLVYEPFKVQ